LNELKLAVKLVYEQITVVQAVFQVLLTFACLGCLLGFSEDGSSSNGVCLLALETCAIVISERVCEVALTQVYVVDL